MPIDLFFSSERPFALLLNLVIIGLALVACALCVRILMSSARKEEQAIRAARAVTPPSRSGIISAVTGTGSMVEQRVNDLAALGRSNAPVDADALSALTALSMERQLQVPAGIGRSLIILGLLGTLWGLGLSVTTLAGTLRDPSAGGFEAGTLVGAIIQTLSGMQTAFGTTLTGIAGALLVGFFVGLARRRYAELIEEFERLFQTVLVPLFDTSEADRLSAAASALEGVQRRVAEDMQGMLAAIDAQGRALGAQLREEFDVIEESFRHRADELIRSTGRALESTLSIIGTRQEGEPTLAEYVRSVRATVEGLEQATESAGRLIPELERTLNASLANHSAQFEGVLRGHQEAMAPVARQYAESAESLSQAAAHNVGHVEELARVLNRFTDAVETVRETWHQTDQLIVQLGESCRVAIEEGLTQVVKDVRAETASGSREREAVLGQLNGFASQLQEHLTRMQEDREANARKLKDVVEAVRTSSSDAVKQVGAKLEQKGDVTGQQVRDALERLARELRDLMPPSAHVHSEDHRWRRPNSPPPSEARAPQTADTGEGS